MSTDADNGGLVKMGAINDEVFGNLTSNYFWEKEEELDFKNEKKQITVVVEAYTGQEILDIQRQQYLVYQQKKNEYISKIPKILLKYYLDNYDFISAETDIPELINKKNINEQLIIKLISINDIYFARNGKYGWLCDCAWDEEHGLCILLSEDEPCIKEQDYLT